MTNWTSKREQLLSPVKQVIDSGIDYWVMNKTESDRLDHFNDIEENESEYRKLYHETKFGDLVSDHTKKKDMEQFAGARLMVATADYQDRGTSTMLVGKDGAVSQNAAERMLDIEKYSQFTRLDDDSLKDHILDHDDRIYGLVKGYVSSQEEMLKTIRGPETELDDDLQIAFLNDRIKTIRGNLKNAAIILIEEDRLSDIIEDIESAVIDAGQASQVRKEVGQTILEELQQFEEQVQWGLREQREYLQAQLQQQGTTDTENIEQYTRQIEQLVEEVSEERTKIDEAIELAEQALESAARDEITSLVENELEELQAQRKELDEVASRFEDEHHRLESTLESIQGPQQLSSEEMPEEGENASSVIPDSVARTYEQDFIARFEQSVYDTPTVTVDDEEISDFELDHDTGNSRGELVEHVDNVDKIRSLPICPWSQFQVIRRGLTRWSKEVPIIIEATTISRGKRYVDFGKDWSETTLAELHVTIEEAQQRLPGGEAADAPHILVIGSPTGWSNQAIKEVEDNAARFGMNVSVYLVDLRTNSPYYAEGDRLLRRNSEVLSHTLVEERVQNCKNDIIVEYVEDSTTKIAIFDSVQKQLDYDPHIVKRAFEELESEGHGEQIMADSGLGLRV